MTLCVSLALYIPMRLAVGSAYMCVCVSLYVCGTWPAFLCAWVYVFVGVYVYLCVTVCLWIYACLSASCVPVSVHVFMHMECVSVHLSV